MKTAIETLIDELKQTRQHCLPEFKTGIDHAILRASAYLETEKEQIVEAYVAGWNDRGNDDGDYKSNESPDEYFNNTYKK